MSRHVPHVALGFRDVRLRVGAGGPGGRRGDDRRRPVPRHRPVAVRLRRRLQPGPPQQPGRRRRGAGRHPGRGLGRPRHPVRRRPAPPGVPGRSAPAPPVARSGRGGGTALYRGPRHPPVGQLDRQHCARRGRHRRDGRRGPPVGRGGGPLPLVRRVGDPARRLRPGPAGAAVGPAGPRPGRRWGGERADVGHQRAGGRHSRVQPGLRAVAAAVGLVDRRRWTGLSVATASASVVAAAVLAGYGIAHGGFPQPSSL